MGALPVVEPWEHETTDGPPVPAPFERFTGDYTTFFRREVRSLVALAAAIAGHGPGRGDRPGGAAPSPPRLGPHRPLRQARRVGAPRHHQPGHLLPAPPLVRAARPRASRRPAPARRPAARGRRVLGAGAAAAPPPGGGRRPLLPRRPEHRRHRRRPRLRRGHRQGPPPPGPPHPRRAARHDTTRSTTDDRRPRSRPRRPRPRRPRRQPRPARPRRPAGRPRADARRPARRPRRRARPRPAARGRRRRRAVHRLGRRARRRPRRRRALAPRARRGRQQAARARARRPHAARSQRRPRLDPAAVTVEPNVDLRDGEVVTVTRPRLRARRAGRHRPVRQRGRAATAPRASAPASTAATSAACSTPTPTTRAWPPAPSRCSACSPRRPPARWTAPLEAERCIVAMGAINDYDRSGGFGVAFAGGGEPIDIPTITVSPAEGLADGDVVHVEGEGSSPAPVHARASAPSIRPAAGRPASRSSSTREDVEDLGLGDEYGGGVRLTSGWSPTRTAASAATCRCGGSSPAPTPGSYVDCAVSACSLRVLRRARRLRPGSRLLGFTSGGAGSPTAGRRGRPRPATSSPATRSSSGAPASSRARTTRSRCARRRPATPTSIYGCVGDGRRRGADRRRRRLRRRVRGPRSARPGRDGPDAPPPRRARPRRLRAGAPPDGARAVRRRPHRVHDPGRVLQRTGPSGRSAAVPRRARSPVTFRR